MDGDLTPHPYCHWPRRYTRSIYQPETWGAVCERGAQYRDAGAPASAGTPGQPETWGAVCERGAQYRDAGAPGQVRKISTGQKARGMASDRVRDALA